MTYDDTECDGMGLARGRRLTHDSQQFPVLAESLNDLVPYVFPRSPQVLGIHEVRLQKPAIVDDENTISNIDLPWKILEASN